MITSGNEVLIVASKSRSVPRSPADSVLPFPSDVFPEPLQRYVEQVSEAIGVPADFVAVPLLASLGSAIGTSRRVEIKSSWRELPTIWVAVVGDPGTAKSPALEWGTRGVKERQKAWKSENERQRATTLLSQGDEKGKDKPKPPALRQSFTTDSTVEALADVLQANPRGVLYCQDELAGWVRAFNQYKTSGGADRQVWLGIWNSATTLINRRNRTEPLHLERPFVSVAGAIQPDLLGELKAEGGRDDGFLGRVLFSYPEAQPALWTDAEPDADVIKRHDRIFKKLFDLQASYSGNPRTVRFAPEARKLFVEFYNRNAVEINSPGFPYSLRGAWAKMAGYCARLALILHMTSVASGNTDDEEINEESMDGAIRLIGYFKSHVRKVSRRLRPNPEGERLERAVDWIRRHGDKATLRDICTYKVAGCRQREQAQSLFRDLEEAGLGMIETRAPKRGGQSSVIFRLHPTKGM